MSPILGIWASAQQPALNATSFESIATVTVGSGGSASVEFTSIPSTYTHLQIRGIFKDASPADNYSTMTVQLNSDTGNNYSRHYLQGDGASVYAGGQATQNGYNYSYATGNTATATNIFSVNIYDILDYANTNKYKTIRHLGGWDFNGSGFVTYGSFSWQSTNAVTSIKITGGASFKQYTQVALYGIKGA